MNQFPNMNTHIFINHIQWNWLLFMPRQIWTLNVSTSQPANKKNVYTFYLITHKHACLLFIFFLLLFIDNFFLGCLDKFECIAVVFAAANAAGALLLVCVACAMCVCALKYINITSVRYYFLSYQQTKKKQNNNNSTHPLFSFYN